MNHKLDTLAFGLSGGIISAVCMLLLGVLGNFGIYEGAAEMMAQRSSTTASPNGDRGKPKRNRR